MGGILDGSVAEGASILTGGLCLDDSLRIRRRANPGLRFLHSPFQRPEQLETAGKLGTDFHDE